MWVSTYRIHPALRKGSDPPLVAIGVCNEASEHPEPCRISLYKREALYYSLGDASAVSRCVAFPRRLGCTQP